MAHTSFDATFRATRSRTGSRRRERRLSERQLRHVLLTMGATVVLIVATMIAFTALPRFAEPGLRWLPNMDFRQGFEGWQTQGIVTLGETELGHAILQNRNPDQSVYLRRLIELPEGRTYLKISADVASHQAGRGDSEWHTARLYAVQRTAQGDYLWNRPYLVTELVGTAGRHAVERTFEIGASVPYVLLSIELPSVTGMLEVANLKVERLEERPLFRLVATLIVAAWCLLGAWVLHHVVSGIRPAKVRVLLLATVLAMASGLFMPTTLRQALIDGLAGGFGVVGIDPDTLGHAVGFAALAFLVRWGRARDPLLVHVAGWLLLALATEVLQIFTPDRDPTATDWFADCVGAGLGLALAEGSLALERLFGQPRRDKPVADATY